MDKISPFLKSLIEKNSKRKLHFFNWDNSYSVGNSKIDKQHQMLFIIIDEIYYTPYEREKREHLDEILLNLKEYCNYHFDTEEKLFMNIDYIHAAEHIKEHRDFMKKINKIYDDFKNGKEITISELMQFIRNWLTNHVLKVDMKYRERLKG